MLVSAENFTKKYFKIYIWKITGYVANLAALAFVTPRTTHSPSLYGIFAFCLSLNIFFQYADLGFINSAQKYAAELYARGDPEKEAKVIGFSSFMFLILIIPIALLMFWFSFHPTLVIKGIENSAVETALASRLLFTLACFAPVLIIQRIVQIIFAVRLDDYIPQRLNVISSILRVLAVFYFFGNGKYMLWEYYLFYNSLSLITLIMNALSARKRYQFNFKLLIQNFKYSSELYKFTSGMAYNSLALSFSWIIFYELDLIYIAYFLGNQYVAYYAIGLTILMFFRDAFGTFYYPFLVRFNHLVGQGNLTGLKDLFHTLLKVGAPLTILPLVTTIALARPLVYSWVGDNYAQSIVIVQLLLSSSLLGFITYPISSLLNARVELKKLYLNALFLPTIYIIGILCTQHLLGITAYALFKMIAIYVNAIFFFFLTLNYLKLRLTAFFKEYILRLLAPVGAVLIFGWGVSNYFTFHKGLNYLAACTVAYFMILLTGFTLYFLSDRYIRAFLKRILSNLKRRNNDRKLDE